MYQCSCLLILFSQVTCTVKNTSIICPKRILVSNVHDTVGHTSTKGKLEISIIPRPTKSFNSCISLTYLKISYRQHKHPSINILACDS